MKSNLANTGKLHYCGCNTGNKSKCGSVAQFRVTLVKRIGENSSQGNAYRCERHKLKGTVSLKVADVETFNQNNILLDINRFLVSLIGKRIKSSAHTARELLVKYIKPNGGVMCWQSHSKKWKFVYYEQIEAIL